MCPVYSVPLICAWNCSASAVSSNISTVTEPPKHIFKNLSISISCGITSYISMPVVSVSSLFALFCGAAGIFSSVSFILFPHPDKLKKQMNANEASLKRPLSIKDSAAAGAVCRQAISLNFKIVCISSIFLPKLTSSNNRHTSLSIYSV